MMELFPHDLLLIATHCGDVRGYRWMYEFKDSEGYDRELVVDIALGAGIVMPLRRPGKPARLTL